MVPFLQTLYLVPAETEPWGSQTEVFYRRMWRKETTFLLTLSDFWHQDVDFLTGPGDGAKEARTRGQVGTAEASGSTYGISIRGTSHGSAGDDEQPSAHTPAKTRSAAYTTGPYGSDAVLHGSQAARARTRRKLGRAHGGCPRRRRGFRSENSYHTSSNKSSNPGVIPLFMFYVVTS